MAKINPNVAGDSSDGDAFDPGKVKRVAVLGAGVAGLQAAQQLKLAGKEVVVFEKSSGVGGVWRANYADFGLQVPRELFEFPGFPYPAEESWSRFPTGPDVQRYIELFVDKMELAPLIRFNTPLVQVLPGSKGKRWTIISETLPPAVGEAKEARESHEEFDFVVVSSGMYNWPPVIPAAPGSGVAEGDDKVFKGELIHSSQFSDASVAMGKKVIVVGGGKSAIDCAVAAAKQEGSESTLLYREAHWPVPRKLLNLVPFKWGTYSRFGHAMLPRHHDKSKLAKACHFVSTPVKWVWWRIVELMFRAQFRLSGDLVPKSRIEIDVFNGGQILSYEFRNLRRARNTNLFHKKGAIARFTEDGVVLRDGTEIKADLVIFGTGFSKSYKYLRAEEQAKLRIERDGLWLYRNILAPELPGVAFIGSEVSTFNNILTHGLQSMWLRRVLEGRIQLPSRAVMVQALEKEQVWKRSWMPDSKCRASIYQLHFPTYHDRLVKDMGEKQCRKGWNVLAEVFSPYQAADYKKLFSFQGDSDKKVVFYDADISMKKNDVSNPQ